MKKLLFFLLLGTAGVASAQTPFFQYVPYKGAFAPAPAARWTDGWANFDPQNTAYPATDVTVSANIATNTTWTANHIYLLDDAFIYVLPGVTLTIEPGTVIRGTGKGTLIVERGAKIIAQGTVNSPIVFTSNNAVGNRDYSDWGGVVICGAAVHNIASGANAEAEGGIGDVVAGRGLHGGTNDQDSSGVLSYVRIEFCGISLTQQANSEVNGLSMYSVGSKTQIDHIQVSYSGDDSYEWFGGTVDCKYIFAYRGWDDDFDTDNGFRGRIQFAASVRDSRIADQSGSNGMESDNDASGSNRYPKTAPVFSNVTIIGPNYQGNPDTTNALYRRALHMRRNTKTTVFNSLFAGYPDAGFNLDGRKTTANMCGDSLEFEYNILAGMNKDFKLSAGDTLCIANEAGLLTYLMDVNRHNDTLAISNDLDLTDPFNLSNPDLRPVGGSPAENGADFSNPKFGTLNTLGVNEIIPEGDFAIYPNPAATQVNLYIEATQHTEAVVTILEITGRTVRSFNTVLENGANHININVEDMSKGIYVVRIDAAGYNLVKKFVKE